VPLQPSLNLPERFGRVILGGLEHAVPINRSAFKHLFSTWVEDSNSQLKTGSM